MSFRRGSLQKGKRHQTAGAEDTDNGPNHVGPRGIVAVRRSRFVSDRHFWVPACCLRSIGRAPLWRLCSIVLRWAGSEPLRDRLAPLRLGDPSRSSRCPLRARACDLGSGGELSRALARVGLSLIASRLEGRKSLRPSFPPRPSFQTPRGLRPGVAEGQGLAADLTASCRPPWRCRHWRKLHRSHRREHRKPRQHRSLHCQP